ncbi:MAG: hypothetical protein WDO73_08035 [Ignavibacteriota bacterium]
MKRVLVPLLAMLAVGCSVGPKYQRPDLQAPTAYKETPPESYKEWHPSNPSDTTLRGDWWTLVWRCGPERLRGEGSMSPTRT